MRIPLQEIVVWVILPFLNFLLWFYFSHTRSLSEYHCAKESSEAKSKSLEQLLDQSIKQLAQEAAAVPCHEREGTTPQCSLRVSHAPRKFGIKFEDTMKFEQFRSEKLASMTVDILLKTYLGTDTVVLYQDSRVPCQTIEHHMSDRDPDVCFAVTFSQSTNQSYNIARMDQDIDIYGLSISNPDPSQVDKYSKKFALNEHNKNRFWPTGFFRKVPKERGRERTFDKLGMFLRYFADINADLTVKLLSHNIKAGDDLVVMVVNEGELDLFLNFACSCRLHNISMHNIMAFVPSSGIVPFIEATGAMALYHKGFAAVSKRASTDYLDRVFVDMMWFKAFSVYLLLRRKINVLFQDVDLVWFKEPMSYFHTYISDHLNQSRTTHAHPEAFFSDDGQRSKRYTPFFANSGFYYLLATERSEYFAWSIMIAMDAIQVLGSHQNVFTTRLLEGLSITTRHTKILSLEAFPTGIMYHHNREYMKLMREKKVSPYNFHMCWTQGKPDKLIYLRKALMWYLTPTCSPLEALIEEPMDEHDRQKKYPPGEVFTFAKGLEQLPQREQWDKIGAKCCMFMPGAP